MTSDAGLASQDTDYTRDIQAVLDELHQMQQTPRLVTSPEELEALEREIRQRTDRLGSLLVGSHLQQALDAAALQAEQERLVRQWPKPLKNDGKVQVRVRTAQGLAVPVWVTYYRRTGQRRAGKRYAGVYAGLVVLGIYDRCTPALAADTTPLAVNDLPTVIGNLTTWITGIIAAVATLFLTIGGARYLMAGGDPSEVERAKGSLKSAGIGYGLALLAPIILTILKNILGG